MAPRGTTLLSLMSSTSYPPLPPIEDLEQLQQTLAAQSAAVSARLAAAAPPDDDAPLSRTKGSGKKNDKKRDRDTRDEEDRERAALAANERAGIALEAVERRRFEPGDVKVKRERGEFWDPVIDRLPSRSVQERGEWSIWGGPSC